MYGSLQITAHVGGANEESVTIHKQSGPSMYDVEGAANKMAIKLVNKNEGDLVFGEGNLYLHDTNSDSHRVKRMMQHKAIIWDTNTGELRKVVWQDDVPDGDIFGTLSL